MPNYTDIIKQDVEAREPEQEQRNESRNELATFLTNTLTGQFDIEDTDNPNQFYIPELGIEVSVAPVMDGRRGPGGQPHLRFLAVGDALTELRRPADFFDAGVEVPGLERKPEHPHG